MLDRLFAPSPEVPSVVTAPSLWLLLMEARVPWEFAALKLGGRWLRRLPRGDGHAVLVFPGLGANDLSTVPLRAVLGDLGYAAQPWSCGFNLGPRPGVLHRCGELVRELRERHGRPVSLVGWSLGGLYAREVAKLAPDAVRCVITLGTPFAGPAKANNAWRFFEFASGQKVDETDALRAQLRVAPRVPTTSIYSRSDGIVAWQGSVQQPDHGQTENIEVVASHIGLGVNPSAWWAVADRLAQPEGQWRPFERTGLYGLKSFIYPDPNRM